MTYANHYALFAKFKHCRNILHFYVLQNLSSHPNANANTRRTCVLPVFVMLPRRSDFSYPRRTQAEYLPGNLWRVWYYKSFICNRKVRYAHDLQPVAQYATDGKEQESETRSGKLCINHHLKKQDVSPKPDNTACCRSARKCTPI